MFRGLSPSYYLQLCSSAAGIHNQLQLHSIHSKYYRVLWYSIIKIDSQFTEKRNMIITRQHNPQSWPPYSPLGKPRACSWILVPYQHPHPAVVRAAHLPKPTFNHQHPQSTHLQSISQNSCLRFPKTECIGNCCWWSVEGRRMGVVDGGVGLMSVMAGGFNCRWRCFWYQVEVRSCSVSLNIWYSKLLPTQIVLLPWPVSLFWVVIGSFLLWCLDFRIQRIESCWEEIAISECITPGKTWRGPLL